MKKFLLLTKMLLVAAGLFVGQSAVAQTTTLLEYGTGDVAWTSEKVAEWTAGGSPALADGIVTISGGNGSYETSKTISPTANAIINVTAVWRAASSTGRYFSDGNGSYFRFGNIIVAQNDQDKKHGYVFTGLNNIGSVTTFTAGSYRVDVTNSTWLKIEAEINTAENKLTTFTIKSEDGTITYASASNVTLTGADYTTVAFGYRKAGSVKTTNKEQLKSVKITQTTQVVTNVGYTINYKLGENLVKSVEGEGVVGQEITADIAVDGTEAGYEDKHYLVIAAEAPTMTLDANASSNVLNIPVRAPYTATLKVTTTIGTNEPVLVETPLVETDAKVHTWSYAYPMYVLDGEKYYKADNTETFGEGGEFTDGQVVEKYVTYSTVDEDVVFFKEAEAAAGTNYSYSNGGSGYVAAQNARDRGISVGTLPAGMYQFTVNITAANRRSLGIRQSTNDQIVSVGTSNEDMTTGVKSAIFKLDEETFNLWINGANSGEVKTNQSEDFDYVLIKKVPATVSKTITEAGFATFCSQYALDFSKDEELKAYIITGNESGSKLALTQVTSVPANTGVLLEGPAAEYNIPVVASAEAVSGNKLVGVIALDDLNLNAKAGYVLMDSPKVGFYLNNNDFTLTANTAYLPANFAGDSARSAYFFSDDITGVANVEAAAEAKAQDGKFIENGKIVIVKNGKKFNAAGAQVK